MEGIKLGSAVGRFDGENEGAKLGKFDGPTEGWTDTDGLKDGCSVGF